MHKSSRALHALAQCPSRHRMPGGTWHLSCGDCACYAGTRCTERLLALGHTVHALCLPGELQGQGLGVAHLQVGRICCCFTDNANCACSWSPHRPVATPPCRQRQAHRISAVGSVATLKMCQGRTTPFPATKLCHGAVHVSLREGVARGARAAAVFPGRHHPPGVMRRCTGGHRRMPAPCCGCARCCHACGVSAGGCAGSQQSTWPCMAALS
jgi:hypothetical protein